MNATKKEYVRFPKMGIALSLAWVLGLAFFFSNAGVSTIVAVLAIYFGGFWGILWLCRLAFDQWRSKRTRAMPSRNRLVYWGLEPAVLLLGVALAWSGTFSLIRFALSVPALERYAQDVKAGKVDLNFEWSHPPRSVGLYRVTVTDLLPDGTVRVITSSDGLFDKAGFAYAPDAVPQQKSEDYYKHLFGPWWRWQQGF